MAEMYCIHNFRDNTHEFSSCSPDFLRIISFDIILYGPISRYTEFQLTQGKNANFTSSL